MIIRRAVGREALFFSRVMRDLFTWCFRFTLKARGVEEEDMKFQKRFIVVPWLALLLASMVFFSAFYLGEKSVYLGLLVVSVFNLCWFIGVIVRYFWEEGKEEKVHNPFLLASGPANLNLISVALIGMWIFGGPRWYCWLGLGFMPGALIGAYLFAGRLNFPKSDVLIMYASQWASYFVLILITLPWWILIQPDLV